MVELIFLIERLPYGGHLLVWLPIAVTIGALLSTVVPAPLLTSHWSHWIFYRALQWCAINVGRARNITDPVAKVELLTKQMEGVTLITSPPFPGARAFEAIGEVQRAVVIADIVDAKAVMTDVKTTGAT